MSAPSAAPMVRSRAMTYLSLLIANVGALGFVAAVTADGDAGAWFAAFLLVVGVANLFAIMAHVVGIGGRIGRIAEEALWVNGGWFVLVALSWADVADWHEYGWGLALVLVAAGVAVWGLWADTRAARRSAQGTG